MNFNYRNDFPFLSGTNRGKPIIYLDSASSAQKPKQVIHTITNFYLNDYANVHRGIYELSERANIQYENVRCLVQQFIRALSSDEIVFVRGTTEGINLVAQSFARTHLKAGDEILVSEMEHHSNFVPWMLLKEFGIQIKKIPITNEGTIDLEVYKNLFSDRTKIVAVSHASNVLGTINPLKEMIALAHQYDAKVVVDGAQAISHLAVDVQDLDCDFYVFSGHKLYGPSGGGVLFGKRKWLDRMPPYQSGGGMIETVSFDEVTFTKGPHKFEAGTPNMAAVIGLGAAIQYINSIGLNHIAQHENKLLNYAEERLSKIEGLSIIGRATSKVGVISFVMDHIHPHDIGTVLDHEGIAIRAGHHCAMPLMARFNVPATARVSFGLYNIQSEIDALIDALLLTKRLFS